MSQEGKLPTYVVTWYDTTRPVGARDVFGPFEGRRAALNYGERHNHHYPTGYAYRLDVLNQPIKADEPISLEW